MNPVYFQIAVGLGLSVMLLLQTDILNRLARLEKIHMRENNK